MPIFDDLSRRVLLAGMGALPLASGAVANIPAGGRSKPCRLWYQRPASIWEEALPLGNGRLGAMVFGRVGQERLQLNEDTMWAGGPYTPDSPDALSALPEVRRLIAQRRYKEAEVLAGDTMMARPMWQMPYGTLGDIFLTFDGAKAPSAYRRELDLETAIATTSYDTGAGQVRHESFASAPDQVIAWRIEASSGRIGFDLGYRGPREAEYGNPDFSNVAGDAIDWMQREEMGLRPDDIVIREDGPGAWLITGRNKAANNVPSALTFAIRVRLLTDGIVTLSDTVLSVGNARWATLLITAATSYINYRDTSGDPVAIVRSRSEKAAQKSFALLRRDHIKDHRALFGAFSFELEGEDRDGTPTDARIFQSAAADDRGLAELYLQYARYLLISSSRPGTQPANLQGLWNAGTNPPWGSKYTININTEMNYWLAEPAGLGACVEPLLRMAEELSVTGAGTARTMYGAGGWVTHHNTDIWRAAAPVDGAFYGLWPCGGAWLCNTLWDQYEYRLDPAMLARLYPVMRGASLFFLDTLVDDPAGRGLVTSPSLSPENGHPFGSSICAGPAMDRQIVRDLLRHTVIAAGRLGVDADLARQISEARKRIAPDQIGQGGQVQEWLDDWDAQAPEQNHRHISHLYGLFPSAQFNLRDTPAFVKASEVSLKQRGDLSTGWATAWRICCWARIGDGDHAHAILKSLIGPDRAYPNLFDAHPPFQIDGNFGGAMGIIEMILQSWGGEVILLPALPAAWPSGRMSGIRARGNIIASIGWTNGALSWLALQGPPSSEVAIRYRGKLQQVRLDGRGRYRMTADTRPGALTG